MEGSIQKQFGTRLRELRKAKELRQEDMPQFGIGYKYYQSIEGGKTNVTLKTIEKLAKAFDVRIADLFQLPGAPQEVEEVMALIMPLLSAGEKRKLRKVKVFLEEILE